MVLPRRRNRWRWWLIVAAILSIAALQWLSRRWDHVAGRELLLREGGVEVVAVEDALTLVVRPLVPSDFESAPTYRVRLFGLAPLADPVLPVGRAAHRWTEAWIDACPGRRIQLVYDHQRFDASETPMAFVCSDHDCLNVRLLEEGLAQLVRYPGMPSRWVRELIKADRSGVE